MKANVGALDRGVRIVVGIVLLAAVLFVDSPLRWWGLIGIVPLATGVLGTCPLYALLGIDTCPMTKKPST
jgi:hypothetical protein